MTNVTELFGSMVFNDRKMQERLPRTTYKALKKTIKNQQQYNYEYKDKETASDDGSVSRSW